MKRVLYISNIEVPYRTKFFSLLAESCDLTVLYEREKATNRNIEWSKSEECHYRKEYLNGIPFQKENSISLKILPLILGNFDSVIFGCFNSPIQLIGMVLLKILHKPYILNLDGEFFAEGTGLKKVLKRFFLRGASQYLVAGEKSAESLSQFVDPERIVVYYFSSLTQEEIAQHAKAAHSAHYGNTVLVIGQYFAYKGMDIALEAAKKTPSIHYKFLGMGNRTELFLEEQQVHDLSNVEIIPFLQKKELENAYLESSMLLLPSRQECWGLVINEAASFGLPIVSTWGSGAAVEFLSNAFPQYLAEPGNVEDLIRAIEQARADSNKASYRDFLLEKSQNYSIERSVQKTLEAIMRAEF